MSELARRERAAKRGWARPGGFHDLFVRFLKIVLPIAVIGFLGYLLLTPLSHNKEVSFLLDKKKVATATERLKTQSARYQGVDDHGRFRGCLKATGIRPSFAEKLADLGIRFSGDLFQTEGFARKAVGLR